MTSQPTPTRLPFGAPFRRIITSHSPSDTAGTSVLLHDDHIPLHPMLDGNLQFSYIFAHSPVPSTSSHTLSATDITASYASTGGVATANGVNAQINDVAPGFKIGMHRTSSIDYNVFLQGSAWLIYPENGEEKRTCVKAGEVVVQRGTMHGWEAGEDGARWLTVVVAAEPVKVGDKALEDKDFK